MQAGKLRHRVTIQQAVEAHNAYGETIRTWSTVATVYASVEPIRGREFFDAEQVQSEISQRVRMRYRSGIKPTMRLLYGSRLLQIQAVIDVEERHREIHLMCREMPDA
jgi:SPP1 family predicted phage head-tail adaptor